MTSDTADDVTTSLEAPQRTADGRVPRIADEPHPIVIGNHAVDVRGDGQCVVPAGRFIKHGKTGAFNAPKPTGHYRPLP